MTLISCLRFELAGDIKVLHLLQRSEVLMTSLTANAFLALSTWERFLWEANAELSIIPCHPTIQVVYSSLTSG